MEINDYPPANAVKSNEARDCPIIRCEECHEIPKINFKMDKRQIQLKCEKEGKTKEIPFENFFESLKKYEDINCCEFCKDKNLSQKYYLCKTCSNKILCEKCYNEHSNKDDVIKFNIDSTCKIHYYPYESYCPMCKENKCSYCSIDHDESHEKDEILLKKKLFKKNKIEAFKKKINTIQNNKDNIEKKINIIVKELEEKIEFINNLKKKFFECLNMKLQFVELIMNNYEKKLENYDVNYFIINNLESQMKFNLLELNVNKNDSLDKKLENVASYLQKNLNSQFNLDNKEESDNIQEPEKIWDNDITSIEFVKIKEFDYDVIGFLDFNKYLFAFYSYNSIYFISKNDYKTIFQLKEYGIEEIKICKKISDEKLLILTTKEIIIIDIIDNNDYKIYKRIDFQNNIYDFNSNLNLLYLNYQNQYNNYYKYKFSIKLLSYPDYNKAKNSFTGETNNCCENDRLQFINNNQFFHFSFNSLNLYKIEDNKFSNISVEINIEPQNVSIIELTDEFYCLNDKRKILLLNKNDLHLAKTINLNSNNLGMLKISDKIISIFSSSTYKLISNNYDILSNGIKWERKETKNLLKETINNFYQSKNYILFMKEGDYDDNGKSFLFEIKTKK